MLCLLPLNKLNVDNTLMFLVIAKQCLDSKSRVFQLLLPSQQESWRGTRSREGTQPGQLTRTGQRAIPYHVTSCLVYKLGGVGLGGIATWELTGRQSAGGEQLHYASFVRSKPFIITVVILLVLSLSLLVSSFLFY